MTVLLQGLLLILIAGIVVIIIAMLSPKVRSLLENWLSSLSKRLPIQRHPHNPEDGDNTEIVFDSIDFAYLLAKSPGMGAPSRIALYGDRPVVVGRSRHQCDVTIREHSISRQHAEFFPQNGQVYVRNLSRSGGTFVNHQRLPLDLPQQLKAGDVVGFFKYEYRFFIEAESTEDMGEPDTVHTPVVDEGDR